MKGLANGVLIAFFNHLGSGNAPEMNIGHLPGLEERLLA